MQSEDGNTRTLHYWAQVEALTAPDAEAHNERGQDFVVTYVRRDEFPWLHKPLNLPQDISFGSESFPGDVMKRKS